jgi:hypothetical protein
MRLGEVKSVPQEPGGVSLRDAWQLVAYLSLLADASEGEVNRETVSVPRIGQG